MTVNSSEILNPARAYVYLAPVGTVAPVDSTVVLPTGWVNVGLTTPDSLQLSNEPAFQEVVSHQSDYPTRQIQTGETGTIAVELQQWNSFNLIGVYGGGEVTEPVDGSGEFKYTPPALGARSERAAIIEVIDGIKHYRWVYARTMQIEGTTTALQKGQEARLPLSLSVLGGDNVTPWTLLTDDPAFAPAA